MKFTKRILANCFFLGVLIFSSSCSSVGVSETPSSYGARAGEEGAKYWKQQNPGQVAYVYQRLLKEAANRSLA